MMVGKGNKSFLQGQGGGAYSVSEQQAIYNQRDSITRKNLFTEKP